MLAVKFKRGYPTAVTPHYDIRKATFNSSYASLHTVCAATYDIAPSSFVLKYEEEPDGDKITMVTDDDLREAIKLAGSKLLTVFVEDKPGQATTTRAPAVLRETLQTIEQFMSAGLQDYLLDPSVMLQKLPRFTPHAKHPFFAEIKAANLLAVPFNSKPDLLLHGLPVESPTLAAIKASAMSNTSTLSADNMEDEEVEVELHNAMEDELSKLRAPTRRVLELSARIELAAFRMKVMTLIGVSGCGKTRTLLEVASIQFGLYFIVNNQGNGGSPDMAVMLSMLEVALRERSDPEEIEGIGEHYLHALLLSRLLVLTYVRKHTQNKKDLPFYWLLLQYRPNVFLPRGEGDDFFSSVFRSVVKCGNVEIMEKMQELLREFYEAEGTQLYIFSDESQDLFVKCENKFKGPSTGAPRSMFSKLVNTWASLSHAVLVLAGTGLRLLDSLALVASAVFKSESDMQDLLIVDFDMYDQLESMQAYITQFFPVPPLIMDYIFSILTGRTRSSALFVIQVLTNQSAQTSESVLHGCVDEVIEIAASQSLENSSMSLRRELKKLHDGTRSDLMSDAQSRLGIIRVLTMCYYYFGKDYVFTSQRALQLVEQAVCPLQRSTSNALVTHIAEPLVAWTAYKFFEDIGSPIEMTVLQQMGAFKILPSSLGLLIERYLIPAIVHYFTKEGVSLDKTEYFKRVFEQQFRHNQVPDWLIGATLDVPNLAAVPAATWIRNSNSGETFVQFLTEDSPGCVLCPEPHMRKDAVVRIKTPPADNRLAFMEFKFRKALSVAECNAAIASTKYSAVARSKRRKYTKAIEIQENRFKAHTGTLRIVFLYPAAATSIQSEIKPNGDVIVILDRHWARDLLAPEVWRMFGALKEKCDEVDK